MTPPELREPEPLTSKPKRTTLSDIVDRLLAAMTHSAGEHSGVELARNSKGDVQIRVAVRTGDEGIVTVQEAAERCRQEYDRLAAMYPMGGNGTPEPREG